MPRIRLREPRQDRRRRKARDAMLRADRLLEAGSHSLAILWASWAHRLDPQCPRTLLVLGLAWSGRGHHARALPHFQVAHLIASNRTPYRLGAEFVAEVAVEAARCCARLRNLARRDHDAEEWGEQVLHWARIAAKDDSTTVSMLAEDPLLLDLRSQVKLLHDPGVSWMVQA